MLYYGNSQLVFDFEVGTDLNYVSTQSPFCDNNNISNFVSNLKIVDKIDFSEDILYALSPEEMYTITSFWHRGSKINKLFSWDEKDWFNSFVDTYKEASLVLGDEIGVDPSIFPERKKLLIKELRNSYPYSSSVIPKKNVLPEFSWCVEDYLYCLIHNEDSIYKEYVNSIIRSSSETLIEFKEALRFNSLVINDSFKQLNSLEEVLEQPTPIIYIHNPFPTNRIRTNVNHLKKVLNVYFKKKNSSV